MNIREMVLTTGGGVQNCSMGFVRLASAVVLAAAGVLSAAGPASAEEPGLHQVTYSIFTV